MTVSIPASCSRATALPAEGLIASPKPTSAAAKASGAALNLGRTPVSDVELDTVI
jgi:hypothetical protein